MLAAIHPPDATRKILDCLGLPSRAPPIAPAASELADQINAFQSHTPSKQYSCLCFALNPPIHWRHSVLSLCHHHCYPP
jgi:hypothetical protein